ncbi:hypothetical protein QFZ63_001537 [Streptomyces sp. B3I7]|uniref:hypothetical protein n=1 Tax=Streptomyces sp. B3I7 TaxID=3042269 RepID=UPI0027811CC7|nr:hypothetical protein [Streptomyces sp. B3I7]MDQ0809823.1 hypothetical protein [Streptomyces sp. B3I7]
MTVPAYLIIHQQGHGKDDVLIEDDNLTLHFEAGWAVLADTAGICYAIPAGQGASIQRVDDQQDPAPEPGGE